MGVEDWLNIAGISKKKNWTFNIVIVGLNCHIKLCQCKRIIEDVDIDSDVLQLFYVDCMIRLKLTRASQPRDP